MSHEGSNGGEHGVIFEDHGEYDLPDGCLPHSLILRNKNSQAHKDGIGKWKPSTKGNGHEAQPKDAQNNSEKEDTKAGKQKPSTKGRKKESTDNQKQVRHKDVPKQSQKYSTKARNQVNKRTIHTRMFHNSKALTNKEPTTDALTPSGPNRNQHDTLQLGNDTIKVIDTRGTTPIEKDPIECNNLENSDSEIQTQRSFLWKIWKRFMSD